MIFEAAAAKVRADMAAPCLSCQSKIFSVLADPKTQEELRVWTEARGGLLQIHAHLSPRLPETTEPCVLVFLMVLQIHKEVFIPYFTPGAKTIESAFKVLADTVEREANRRNRLEAAGDKRVI